MMPQTPRDLVGSTSSEEEESSEDPFTEYDEDGSVKPHQSVSYDARKKICKVDPNGVEYRVICTLSIFVFDNKQIMKTCLEGIAEPHAIIPHAGQSNKEYLLAHLLFQQEILNNPHKAKKFVELLPRKNQEAAILKILKQYSLVGRVVQFGD
jgi:hypothetical protein